MFYNKTRPLIGVTGRTHQSASEAETSFQLARLGITPCDAYYPVTFKDADGATFKARSDFIHNDSGVRIEFKAGNLNGKKTIAHAAVAEAKLMRDVALGFVSVNNLPYRRLKIGWNHSVHKQKAVVAALTPANFVLVLKHEPNASEVAKMRRAGIFWRTMKTIPVYAFFLKLASLGLDVGFKTDTHVFTVSGTA